MTTRKRISRNEVRRWVFAKLMDGPENPSVALAAAFGFSRQNASWHLDQMVRRGDLTASGRTRARKYALAYERLLRIILPLDENPQEHEVWAKYVAPLLAGLPPNVLRICAFGFQEMFNNVIDHSESERVALDVERGPGVVTLRVIDFGVGIFTKIQQELGFGDPRDVVVQLVKGKLTTDPTRHTGEGIFFTSRMFDVFSLYSSELFWACQNERRDWLLEARRDLEGTSVVMSISPLTTRTDVEVFDKFSEDEDYRFMRTEVPVLLAKFSEDPLVSRSAARRVVARLERFDEVYLDFTGVDAVGQPFADEIFRVFAAAHPEIRLHPVHTNPTVDRMISRAVGARRETAAADGELHG